jgi:hypothetical protein
VLEEFTNIARVNMGGLHQGFLWPARTVLTAVRVASSAGVPQSFSVQRNRKGLLPISGKRGDRHAVLITPLWKVTDDRSLYWFGSARFAVEGSAAEA